MKKLNAALAAVAMLAVPAVAAFAVPAMAAVTVISAPNQGREQVSVRVSTEGLDTADASDVRHLRNRADRAIEKACNPRDRINSTGARDWQCIREMRASAERATSRMANN